MMPVFSEQEQTMQNVIDNWWDGPEFDAGPLPKEKPNLARWQWSFAYLPDARMKAVAAGWMVRVLLGADPAEMSEEEMRILSVGAHMASDRRSWESGHLCDA
jgi:hypothetical protein